MREAGEGGAAIKIYSFLGRPCVPEVADRVEVMLLDANGVVVGTYLESLDPERPPRDEDFVVSPVRVPADLTVLRQAQDDAAAFERPPGRDLMDEITGARVVKIFSFRGRPCVPEVADRVETTRYGPSGELMSTRLAALNPQRLAREHDFLAAEKPPPPEQALLQAIEAAATAFRHLAAGPRSDAVRGIWILRVLAGRSAHDDARVQEALGELEWYGDRWASSLAEGTDTAAVIWGAGCDPPLPADPEDQAAVAVDLMQALNLDLSRLAVGSVERAKARADLAIRIHTAARGVSSLDWNTCQGRVQAYLDHLDDRLAHAGRDRILRLVAATADFEDPFAAGFAIGSNPSDLLDQSVWPDPDAPPDTSALT